VSRGLISSIERDRLESISIGAFRKVAAALEARFLVDLQWDGAELNRLLDAGHAALVEWLASMLQGHGWEGRAEVSFNHFGDRGRYDLLAFHPATGVLLVAEVKTAIGDLQDLFGRIDVKLRLALRVSSGLGWKARAVVPLLLVAEGTTNRRHARGHPVLFGRFPVRGTTAAQWLRSADLQEIPSGLLVFRKLPYATHGSVITRRRLRKPHPQLTRASGADSAVEAL
jgi:hypothetical protein